MVTTVSVLPTGGTVKTELSEALFRRMKDLRTTSRSGLAQNPVLALAVETSQKLALDTLSVADLGEAAKVLMDRAAERRAGRIARKARLKTNDPLGAFAAQLRASATDWATFQAQWSQPRCGVVFTAHPTFAMSRGLSRAVVNAAQARIDPATPQGFSADQRGDDQITLADEHRAAAETMSNFHEAFRRLAARFYDVAAELYPEQWTGVRPGLVTGASWVGYDLDGRTDIVWTDTFKFRLTEKGGMLTGLHDRLMAIAQAFGAEDHSGLADIARTLMDGAHRARHDLDLLTQAGDDPVRLIAAANAITAPGPDRLITLAPVVEALTQVAQSCDDRRMARDLMVLATMCERFGPTGRQMHMRINAKQLNNAFQAHVAEPWARDTADRSTATRIARMIAELTPRTVNFGSLMNEPTTAIRQFAAASQLRKHIDADTPIRFLVAECEEPVTILIAIYFAKLFGVADALDISPLFETAEGLDFGASMMDRLFLEPAYVDYVRARGRICIQTGFSDAGRFIGQIPAALAIENLQTRLADAVAHRGLGDLEVLIFNTHGESMGRGAHPGGYEKRFRYILSDRARGQYASHGIPLTHEISFQGGDGFLHLGTPMLATAVVTAFLLDSTAKARVVEDPFYSNFDFYLDFVTRMREFHSRLYQDPGYRGLLASFGPNLLLRTGSRAVKRAGSFGTPASRDPARMRAIPNNAILQQVGYLSNVVAGLGVSAGQDPTDFVEIARASPRLQLLLEMVVSAKRLSSINSLTAYAAMLDPGFWASLAYVAAGTRPVKSYELLAHQFLDDDRSAEIARFAHFLRLDGLRLHALLDRLGIDGGQEPDGERLELDTLHAIRIALIMQVFLTAADAPEFASRNDVSHAQFMSAATSLEIEESVSFLRRAFPRQATGIQGQFEEPASYRPFGTGGYAGLEERIFVPMLETYRMIREIGLGISHNFDAYG